MVKPFGGRDSALDPAEGAYSTTLYNLQQVLCRFIESTNMIAFNYVW